MWTVSYLPPRDLVHAALVCKNWSIQSSENEIWKVFLEEIIPSESKRKTILSKTDAKIKEHILQEMILKFVGRRPIYSHGEYYCRDPYFPFLWDQIPNIFDRCMESIRLSLKLQDFSQKRACRSGQLQAWLNNQDRSWKDLPTDWLENLFILDSNEPTPPLLSDRFLAEMVRDYEPGKLSDHALWPFLAAGASVPYEFIFSFLEAIDPYCHAIDEKKNKNKTARFLRSDHIKLALEERRSDCVIQKLLSLMVPTHGMPHGKESFCIETSGEFSPWRNLKTEILPFFSSCVISKLRISEILIDSQSLRGCLRLCFPGQYTTIFDVTRFRFPKSILHL